SGALGPDRAAPARPRPQRPELGRPRLDRGAAQRTRARGAAAPRRAPGDGRDREAALHLRAHRPLAREEPAPQARRLLETRGAGRPLGRPGLTRRNPPLRGIRRGMRVGPVRTMISHRFSALQRVGWLLTPAETEDRPRGAGLHVSVSNPSWAARTSPGRVRTL